MSGLIIDILSWIFILSGSAFVLIGAIGLVRMPDIYTRIHAVSVSDTLGAGLLLTGLMLQAGFSLITLKLIFLLALFFFTGPVATHALAQAAFHENIKPILHEDRRASGPDPEPSPGHQDPASGKPTSDKPTSDKEGN